MRKKEPEHPYSYKSALSQSREKQPKVKKRRFGLRKKEPEPPAEPPAEEAIKIVGDDNSVFIVDPATNKLYYITTVTDEMGREVEIRREVVPTFGLNLP